MTARRCLRRCHGGRPARVICQSFCQVLSIHHSCCRLVRGWPLHCTQMTLFGPPPPAGHLHGDWANLLPDTLKTKPLQCDAASLLRAAWRCSGRCTARGGCAWTRRPRSPASTTSTTAARPTQTSSSPRMISGARMGAYGLGYWSWVGCAAVAAGSGLFRTLKSPGHRIIVVPALWIKVGLTGATLSAAAMPRSGLSRVCAHAICSTRALQTDADLVDEVLLALHALTQAAPLLGV